MHTPELNDDLYWRFRELLRSRCGLYYPERKRADLAHGLSMALQAGGQADMEQLYREAAGHGPAWDLILEHLTNGETYFFRNEPQFEALRHTILPDLLTRRAATRTLRIWSAGCSTGEEPYSLAMLLREMLPDVDSWNISLLATDINPDSLTRAREGLYGEWSFRDTSEPVRKRFFEREESRWRISSDIRRMVIFTRLNLVEPSYPSVANGTAALDLILCRNVTIYFDESTTQRLAERFYQALAPGGWLVVGHAEPHARIYHQFEVHTLPGTIIYRKALNTPFFPALQEADYSARRRKASSATAAEASAGSAVEPHGDHQRAGCGSARPVVNPRPASLAWDSVERMLQDEQHDLAEKMLHRLLDSDPRHPGALLALARIRADSGDLDGAAHYCALLLDSDPLQVEAHYLHAQVLEHRGELEAALDAYRRSVFLDQEFIAGHIGMAQAWQRLGRTAAARRCYRNAVQRLRRLPPSAPVPGLGPANAAEILALISQQAD